MEGKVVNFAKRWSLQLAGCYQGLGFLPVVPSGAVVDFLMVMASFMVMTVRRLRI